MTNFLQEGALLRHQDQWILVEGPFIEKSFHSGSGWGVYVTDFYDLNTQKLWQGKQTHILTPEEFESFLQKTQKEIFTAEATLESASWEEPPLEHFSEALKQIQNRITTGDLKKAVPVVFAKTNQTVTSFDRLQMMLELLSAPANLHVYGFWKNGEGFLGATPEILFQYKDSILQTMSLAGTCPKEDQDSRKNLLSDPKEMLEHQIVTEDLLNELQAFGEIHSEGPYVMELPTLLHLRTDLTVHCKTAPDFLSLIKKLHPTPALGVAPRDYGIGWMQDFPGQKQRRWYGAPVGFFHSNEALCLVGIRNIQWAQDSARIGSGCGIVADSTLDREWRELAQKRQSVRKILGL